MEGVEMITDPKDFDTMCRICLKCDEAEKIKEFKPLLYQLFKKLMDIPEKSNPNLPKGVCKECKSRLENISAFIETCKVNQTILEEKYLNCESKENDENIINIETDKNSNKILDQGLTINSSNVMINMNATEDCFEIKQEYLNIENEDTEMIKYSKLKDKFKSNNKDLNEICRVCLIEPKPPDLQEFQPHLYNLFRKLIEIPKNEIARLPRKICKECKSNLENISVFIDKCKTNEIHLEKSCLNKTFELISDDTNTEIEILPNEKTEENELNMMVNTAKEELNVCPEDIKLEYKDVQLTDLDDADVVDDSLDPKRRNCNTILSLPDKSRQRYETCHKQFIQWMRSNKGNHSSISENLLIEYVEEISQKIKPSSLWSQYSMLRSTLQIYNNLDITNCLRLKALLKYKSRGYIPKKPKTLTIEQIQRFISEAPDEIYLLTKVALIIGISGSCVGRELCQMKIDNVEDLGTAAIFKINDNKSKHPRVFTITDRFYEIFKKYYNLRPPHINERRLFIKYQHGKCSCQVVGINKLGTVPKVVAKYLHLKDAELYTAHSFRKTSQTVSLCSRQRLSITI